MAYSDDEAEPVIKSVSNYYFIDTEEEPISFSVLPLFDNKGPKKSEKQVFLHGMGDGGLQKVYKQVTSWKLRLEEDEQPEIIVLTKDKKWIQLSEPRKSYMDTVRTVMITAHVLHFLKRKPHSSGKTLWGHVNKVLRTLKSPPSVKDLKDHYPLLRLLMERDRALSKSEWLLGFLKENPRKKPFIIKDDSKEDVGSVDGDEEDMDLFENVCAICDNGGKLLCCEGRCMRSFHATSEDGEDSNCKSLGFSRSHVEASQKFLCKNCKYNQHQCFACGKLGSSDKRAGVEVFSCVKLTCGHFFHPKCVADLLFRKNKTKAAECEKKIAAGEPFTCPVHKCHVCKQEENREVEESQFAVCRRCPKSYHRKCLPREIAFEDIEEEGIVQRAWEYLLPDRILIYCLEHKIEEDLGTPSRNHVTFPEIVERKKDSDMKKSKVKVVAKNNRIEEAPRGVTRESILKKIAVPSTHPYAVENIDKRITLCEVKNSSEAHNKALQILRNGATVEEAKAVCQPDVLNQLTSWDKELKAYLGPFLYHTNYTSFGRCFTKVDKLQHIVNKLHWYVQNDDMIVDFCCGANDFSRLMKEKLDEAGKRCSFKNYDNILPKDDFNFEKKDWMKVEPQELPTGSKLILGLSPPFGVDPSLANEFIDKALTFKPKLLILTVPRGTQKLDSKSPRYELIWEDCKLLSGKSFYMPGSVNEDDMQIEQSNLEPLSLYLWSRADWTTIYKTIALQRGHASTAQQEPPYDERTRSQSQVVRPPKKQILERHAKEVAIAQQATTKDVNNKKITVESKRRIREPTAVQGADGRNEGETHVSAPETRDSDRDISKSRHPLEPSETPNISKSQHPLEPSETPTTKEGNNKKMAVESKWRTPLVIDNNFGGKRRRETTTVQGAGRRNESETHISPPETRDSNRDICKSQHPLEPSETPTTKEGNNKKIAVEIKKRTTLVIDNNFGRKRRRETTTVQGVDRRNEGEAHVSPPETRDLNRDVSKSQLPLEPSDAPTTKEGNNKKMPVESKRRTPLVIDNNFGRQRRRETTTVQGADRRNEGETLISPPETRDSNRDVSKSQHPLEPSETPITKEGNNKKIAVGSKKRTTLVIDNFFGRKRRRDTTTVQGADRRIEGEMHISPPETRDSNRDISKSQHPLEPSEPSETPRKTFPTSSMGAQWSRSSLDASGFASGPVHPLQHSSCGWLDD